MRLTSVGDCVGVSAVGGGVGGVVGDVVGGDDDVMVVDS